MEDNTRHRSRGHRSTFAHVPDAWFVLRTPLLALEVLTAWAVADEPRAYLHEVVARPHIREALFLATPRLIEQMDAEARGADSPAMEEIELSLARYLSRMAGRATPFGLFAGISTGALGDATSLQLAPSAEYRRTTRLDSGYLYGLADTVSAGASELGTYRPNSSLYTVGDAVRYVARQRGKQTVEYDLVSAELTPYLSTVLRGAVGGRRRAQLAEILVSSDDVSFEEASEYIDQLIDAQVLLSDMTPPITGIDPLGFLVERIAAAGQAEQAGLLARARLALTDLDVNGIGNSTKAYASIAEDLRGLPVAVDDAQLFQVDMVKPGKLNLETDVSTAVLRATESLQRISPTGRERAALETFCRQFSERYEDRRVRLIEALDEDRGLGFDSRATPGSDGAPLLMGLPFAAGTRAEGERREWGRFEAHMLRRLMDATSRGEREIALEERDLAAMENPDALPLADAFMVQLRLAESSSGITALHLMAHGPSGAQVLGRFCHMSGEVERLVRRQQRIEEALRPDAVFAEIVHLGEGRLGNVICRPVLREHEIVYLARSGASEPSQIDVNDLDVEVRGSKVFLHSRRLGKEVVPRMANAHNYGTSSLPVYRFLCAVQGASSVYWSWHALNSAPWLPRVRIANVVVSRERWNLAEDELKQFSRGLRSDDPVAAARALRERLRLPRFVVVADGDNELPIDFENRMLLEVFARLISPRKQVQLTEMYPEPGASPVRGPEGTFANEAIILFAREPERQRGEAKIEQTRDAAEVRAPIVNAVDAPTVQRSFVPGSEWLYLKVYSGQLESERLLIEEIVPLIRRLEARGEARQWFFVRYQDPHHHLRIRVMGNPKALGLSVMPALERALQPLLESGAVWRVQYDTYVRETERYGGPLGLPLCEQLFAYESDAVLSIISTLSRRDRWIGALLASESLLQSLGLTHQERHGLYCEGKKYLAREHRAGTQFFAKVGEFYRRERVIMDAIAARVVKDETWTDVVAALELRDRRIAPVVSSLRELELRKALSMPVHRFAASLLHMQFNRIFHASPRAQELVSHDLLRRILESRYARGLA